MQPAEHHKKWFFFAPWKYVLDLSTKVSRCHFPVKNIYSPHACLSHEWLGHEWTMNVLKIPCMYLCWFCWDCEKSCCEHFIQFTNIGNAAFCMTMNNSRLTLCVFRWTSTWLWLRYSCPFFCRQNRPNFCWDLHTQSWMSMCMHEVESCWIYILKCNMQACKTRTHAVEGLSHDVKQICIYCITYARTVKFHTCVSCLIVWYTWNETVRLC